MSIVIRPHVRETPAGDAGTRSWGRAGAPTLRFYRTLDLALERLREHPEMAPVCRGVYRRLLVRQFGVGVFYALGIIAVYGPAWRAASTSPALATRSA